MRKCVFCGSDDVTRHHLLPKRVKRIMNWNNKRAKKAKANHTVPMCKPCHDKVTNLQEPLIQIIQHLVLARVPNDFGGIMDTVHDKLFNREKENKKDG